MGCPSCQSTTSLEDCDENAEMEKCFYPPQARCFVTKAKPENPDQYYYSRGCASEETYQDLTSHCADDANDCQVGFCLESDCLASLGN
ncbi:hypothetical protein OS493_034141 [Desmophyllum pertusum]|uniref:Uncharacterized protein n=1 Tax=Desmophyllum pertusum TaxID=174260 RepID=A0A9W9Y813_9CNID|nr:hypothetical protein OS493_034141 [Desmophyllum pertusum]